MADQDPPERSGGYAFPMTRRVTATLKNVAEVVRFGGLETGEKASPFTATRGIVAPSEVSRKLSTIPAVDLCVTFGVGHDGANDIVSAVTVRPGGELLTADLNLALDGLSPSHHPGHVQVVQSIPVTTWHRPISAGLQKAGIPKPTKKRRVWRLDSHTNS